MTLKESNKKEEYVLLKKEEFRELLRKIDELEGQILTIRSILATMRAYFYHIVKEIAEKFKEF